MPFDPGYNPLGGRSCGSKLENISWFLGENVYCFELDQGNESPKRMRVRFKLGTRAFL